MTWPEWVWPSSSSSRLARPKSVILGEPSGGEEDVGRLQVAMDHARPVRRADRPGERHHQLGRGPLGLGGRGDPTLQTSSFEKLQRDVGQAVGLADIVDLHHVGMPEPGDGSGLDPEPGQVLRGRVVARPDHLERDQPFQPVLAGPIDHPHPAVPEPPEDLVAFHLGHDLGRRPVVRDRERSEGRWMTDRQGPRPARTERDRRIAAVERPGDVVIDPWPPLDEAKPLPGQLLQGLLALAALFQVAARCPPAHAGRAALPGAARVARR